MYGFDNPGFNKLPDFKSLICGGIIESMFNAPNWRRCMPE